MLVVQAKDLDNLVEEFRLAFDALANEALGAAQKGLLVTLRFTDDLQATIVSLSWNTNKHFWDMKNQGLTLCSMLARLGIWVRMWSSKRVRTSTWTVRCLLSMPSSLALTYMSRSSTLSTPPFSLACS